MIRSRFASALALAAFLAAPAFAQSTSNSVSGTASDQHSGAMSSSTQKAATPRNHASTAQRAAADQGRTPLCSELGNPNAGKLADKSTGQASANSASAVHMDCLPDGSTTAATSNMATPATTGTTAGNTTDVTNSARQGGISGSTAGTARPGSTSPSPTTSGTNSNLTNSGR